MAEEGRSTACRGIRGAITVEGAGPAAVRDAVNELLVRLVEANSCRPEDVAAAIFTVTEDLTGVNPAAAARDCGWESVPLLTVREHPSDTEVNRCIRILVLWNTSLAQADVRHVYLGGTSVLRPDLQALSGPRRRSLHPSSKSTGR